jgi:hypothetical protein
MKTEEKATMTRFFRKDRNRISAIDMFGNESLYSGSFSEGSGEYTFESASSGEESTNDDTLPSFTYKGFDKLIEKYLDKRIFSDDESSYGTTDEDTDDERTASFVSPTNSTLKRKKKSLETPSRISSVSSSRGQSARDARGHDRTQHKPKAKKQISRRPVPSNLSDLNLTRTPESALTLPENLRTPKERNAPVSPQTPLGAAYASKQMGSSDRTVKFLPTVSEKGEYLVSPMGMKSRLQSVQSETSFELELQSLERTSDDGDEEVIFGAETRDDEPSPKPDSLWGGLSLWEKTPLRSRSKEVKKNVDSVAVIPPVPTKETGNLFVYSTSPTKKRSKWGHLPIWDRGSTLHTFDAQSPSTIQAMSPNTIPLMSPEAILNPLKPCLKIKRATTSTDEQIQATLKETRSLAAKNAASAPKKVVSVKHTLRVRGQSSASYPPIPTRAPTHVKRIKIFAPPISSLVKPKHIRPPLARSHDVSVAIQQGLQSQSSAALLSPNRVKKVRINEEPLPSPTCPSVPNPLTPVHVYHALATDKASSCLDSYALDIPERKGDAPILCSEQTDKENGTSDIFDQKAQLPNRYEKQEHILECAKETVVLSKTQQNSSPPCSSILVSKPYVSVKTIKHSHAEAEDGVEVEVLRQRFIQKQIPRTRTRTEFRYKPSRIAKRLSGGRPKAPPPEPSLDAPEITSHSGDSKIVPKHDTSLQSSEVHIGCNGDVEQERSSIGKVCTNESGGKPDVDDISDETMTTSDGAEISAKESTTYQPGLLRRVFSYNLYDSEGRKIKKQQLASIASETIQGTHMSHAVAPAPISLNLSLSKRGLRDEKCSSQAAIKITSEAETGAVELERGKSWPKDESKKSIWLKKHKRTSTTKSTSNEDTCCTGSTAESSEGKSINEPSHYANSKVLLNGCVARKTSLSSPAGVIGRLREDKKTPITFQSESKDVERMEITRSRGVAMPSAPPQEKIEEHDEDQIQVKKGIQVLDSFTRSKILTDSEPRNSQLMQANERSIESAPIMLHQFLNFNLCGDFDLPDGRYNDTTGVLVRKTETNVRASKTALSSYEIAELTKTLASVDHTTGRDAAIQNKPGDTAIDTGIVALNSNLLKNLVRPRTNEKNLTDLTGIEVTLATKDENRIITTGLKWISKTLVPFRRVGSTKESDVITETINEPSKSTQSLRESKLVEKSGELPQVRALGTHTTHSSGLVLRQVGENRQSLPCTNLLDSALSPYPAFCGGQAWLEDTPTSGFRMACRPNLTPSGSRYVVSYELKSPIEVPRLSTAAVETSQNVTDSPAPCDKTNAAVHNKLKALRNRLTKKSGSKENEKKESAAKKLKRKFIPKFLPQTQQEHDIREVTSQDATNGSIIRHDKNHAASKKRRNKSSSNREANETGLVKISKEDKEVRNPRPPERSRSKERRSRSKGNGHARRKTSKTRSRKDLKHLEDKLQRRLEFDKALLMAVKAHQKAGSKTNSKNGKLAKKPCFFDMIEDAVDNSCRSPSGAKSDAYVLAALVGNIFDCSADTTK